MCWEKKTDKGFDSVWKKPEADRTVIDRLSEKIGGKYLIVSLILLLVQGFLVLGLFWSCFSVQANGWPYLETKLGYTPSDLLEMVEGYGTEGRALYVKSALSMDLITPLLASNLLTALALYLTGKFRGGKAWRRGILCLGIALCASDWLENFAMVGLIRTWPELKLAPAVLARILTSVKYLLMAVFLVVLIREILRVRRERKAD